MFSEAKNTKKGVKNVFLAPCSHFLTYIRKRVLGGPGPPFSSKIPAFCPKHKGNYLRFPKIIEHSAAMAKTQGNYLPSSKNPASFWSKIDDFLTQNHENTIFTVFASKTGFRQKGVQIIKKEVPDPPHAEDPRSSPPSRQKVVDSIESTTPRR